MFVCVFVLPGLRSNIFFKNNLNYVFLFFLLYSYLLLLLLLLRRLLFLLLLLLLLLLLYICFVLLVKMLVYSESCAMYYKSFCMTNMYVILYFEYNIFSYVCLFSDLSSNSFTWSWNKFVPCFTLIYATVSTCRTNGM